MKQENQNQVQDAQNGKIENDAKKTAFRRTGRRVAGTAKSDGGAKGVQKRALKINAASGETKTRGVRKASGSGTSMNAAYLPVYETKRIPKAAKTAPKGEQLQLSVPAAAQQQTPIKAGKTFIADARYVREKATERALERAYEKMYGEGGEASVNRAGRAGRGKSP